MTFGDRAGKVLGTVLVVLVWGYSIRQNPALILPLVLVVLFVVFGFEWINKRVAQKERVVEPDFKPDWVSPPGESITDIMEERGITKRQLGEALGLTLYGVNTLLDGSMSIEPSMARKLARYLGSTALFWVQRDLDYRSRLEEFRVPEKDVTHPQMVQISLYENRHGGHNIVVEGYGKRLTATLGYSMRMSLKANRTMMYVAALVEGITEYHHEKDDQRAGSGDGEPVLRAAAEVHEPPSDPRDVQSRAGADD